MAAAEALFARWRARLARLQLAPFRPYLLDSLRGYDRARFLKDLSAGAFEPVTLAPAEAPAGVEAYRLFGSLFFGAVSKLEAVNDPTRYAGAHAPRITVFDLALLISLDTTGVDALDTLRRQLARWGGTLILAGPHEQPLSMLARSGFIERVGADNIVTDMQSALARASMLVASA